MAKHSKSMLIRIANLSSIGVGFAVAISVSLFIGISLDAKLGTRPYITIILLLLGVAAGFRNLLFLVKKYGVLSSPAKDSADADLGKKT